MSDRFIKLITYSITHQCNLMCKFCNVPKGSDSFNEINIDTFIDFLINIKPYILRKEEGGFGLVITGGEPTLRIQKCMKIIDVCNKYSIPTYLSTNGTLIDKKMAKSIIDIGPSVVSISLDSMDSNIHDFIRGQEGAFFSTKKGIENLISYKRENIKIMVQTVLNKYNIHSIGDIIEYCGYNSINIFGFQPIDSERKDVNTKLSYCQPDDVEKLENVIIEGKKKWPNLKLEPKWYIRLIIDYFKNVMVLPGWYYNMYGPCWGGKSYFHIDPYGNVYPCIVTYHKFNSNYNIKKSNIISILTNGELNCFRRDKFGHHCIKCLNRFRSMKINREMKEND